jgi:hypothetical protein
VSGVGLAEALERAAEALPAQADAIRPANGDPARLLELAGAAGAAAVLAWLLEHEPADGAELAEAFAEDPERGSAALLAVAEPALSKSGRKALRRARHQLRSRGLEVPEPERTGGVATLPPVEEPFEQAALSPLDPRGACAAFLVTSSPGGGTRLFELVLDEARGVLDLRVYAPSRSQARKLLKSFTASERFPAVAVPADALRALVARCAQAHPASRPPPRAFSEWRAQLAAPAAGARTPGELAREALGAQAEPARVRRAAEQVRAGALGPWPPAPELLQPLADRLLEVARGTIIVSGARRREELDRVLEEALAGLFAAPFAAQTAARFEEAAFWLWQRGREEEARDALAAAAAFRAGEPRENPVAKAMIEAILAPVFAKAEEAIRAEEGATRLVQPPSGGGAR